MKTILCVLCVLSIVTFGSLAVSGQLAPGRYQRGNAPANGGNNGANYSTGAEYATVSVAPRAGGAYNQGNTRGNIRQQGRLRRSAEFVTVSIAPRR